MLHALYIVAFAVLAVIAASNLIRNLMLLGSDATRESRKPFTGGNLSGTSHRPVPHPEMLDNQGRIVDEPLLVMKSISIEDARDQLDALYNSSTAELNGDAESDN